MVFSSWVAEAGLARAATELPPFGGPGVCLSASGGVQKLREGWCWWPRAGSETGPCPFTHTLRETPETLGTSEASQRHPGGAGEILQVGRPWRAGQKLGANQGQLELFVPPLAGESLLPLSPASLSNK